MPKQWCRNATSCSLVWGLSTVIVWRGQKKTGKNRKIYPSVEEEVEAGTPSSRARRKNLEEPDAVLPVEEKEAGTLAVWPGGRTWKNRSQFYQWKKVRQDTLAIGAWRKNW